MNKDFDRSQDADDDDDDAWTSLAEDLFGSEPDAVLPPVAPPPGEDGETSFSDELSPMADDEGDTPCLDPASEPESPSELMVSSPDERPPEDEDPQESTDGDEDLTRAIVEPDFSGAASEEDPFWNALSEWDWEGDRSPAAHPPRQGESGQPQPKPQVTISPDKQAPNSPDKQAPQSESTSVPKPPRPRPRSETAGFGSGLFKGEDETDHNRSPDESSAGSATAEERSEADEPPRRRRRRRRRLTEEETSEVSTEPTAEMEPAEEATAEETVEETVEETAKETVEDTVNVKADSSGEAAPERKRRKRKRGRRRAKSSDAVAEPEAVEVSQPETLDDEQDAQEEEGNEAGSAPSKERSQKSQEVPTWEEAISYILNPSQVESAGGKPAHRQKNTPKADSTEEANNPKSRRKSSTKKPGGGRKRRS